MYSIEWRNRYWYCVPEMSKMKMNKLPSTRHASHSRVCVCVCVCVSLMHAQICQAITNTRLIYEWLFCAYSLIVARRCSFIFIGHELRGSFFLTLLQYGHIYLLPLSQCITLFVYLLCIYGNAFIISTIVLCERREPFAWIFFQLNCDCRWLWLHLMPVQMNLQA